MEFFLADQFTSCSSLLLLPYIIPLRFSGILSGICRDWWNPLVLLCFFFVVLVPHSLCVTRFRFYEILSIFPPGMLLFIYLCIFYRGWLSGFFEIDGIISNHPTSLCSILYPISSWFFAILLGFFWVPIHSSFLSFLYFYYTTCYFLPILWDFLIVSGFFWPSIGTIFEGDRILCRQSGPFPIPCHFLSHRLATSLFILSMLFSIPSPFHRHFWRISVSEIFWRSSKIAVKWLDFFQ